MPFSTEVLEDAIRRSESSSLALKALQYFDDEDVYTGHLECLKNLHLNPIFYTLSAIYSIGDEVEASFNKRHINFLELAADKGDGLASLALAVYSETGDFDFPLNDGRAEEYYKKSSETGIAWSCFVYGYFYLRKNKETEKQGLDLIQYAAEQGLQDAIDFVNNAGVYEVK